MLDPKIRFASGPTSSANLENPFECECSIIQQLLGNKDTSY